VFEFEVALFAATFAFVLALSAGGGGAKKYDHAKSTTIESRAAIIKRDILLLFSIIKLLHRIVAAFTERLAAQYAPNAHSDPAKHAVFFDGLFCIFRTCRFKSARRRQQRRNERLIQTDHVENQKLHRINYNATASSKPLTKRPAIFSAEPSSTNAVLLWLWIFSYPFSERRFAIFLNSASGSASFTARISRRALSTRSNLSPIAASSVLLSRNASRKRRFARFLS